MPGRSKGTEPSVFLTYTAWFYLPPGCSFRGWPLSGHLPFGAPRSCSKVTTSLHLMIVISRFAARSYHLHLPGFERDVTESRSSCRVVPSCFRRMWCWGITRAGVCSLVPSHCRRSPIIWVYPIYWSILLFMDVRVVLSLGLFWIKGLWLFADSSLGSYEYAFLWVCI